MTGFVEKSIRHIKYWFASGTMILAYHRISESPLDPWSLSVRPEHFAEHLAVVRRSFQPRSLQDVGQDLRSGRKLHPKSIVITFDDGYADNLHIALPLLERFDIPATIFLVTGAIGSRQEFWWDELTSLLLKPNILPDQLDLSIHGKEYSWRLGKSAEYRAADYARYSSWRVSQPTPSLRHTVYMQLWELIHSLPHDDQKEVMNQLRAWSGNPSGSDVHRILNRSECAELARSGWVEIGAHTINHPSLASLSIDSQRHEILESKACLEEILRRSVNSFSYPFGKRHDYTVDTGTLVRESGFSVACSSMSGIVDAKTDPFQLPRIHIHDCGGDEFENRLLSKLYA